MTKTAITCLDQEQLLNLLDNDSIANPTLVHHLAECTTCQNSLDRLTDSAELASYQRVIFSKDDLSRHFEPATDDSDLGTLDDIIIEGKIGSGGMGVVFRGRDVRLARNVAVKLLSQRTSYESDARFLRESRAAAKLQHDHIVSIYSTGRTKDRTPYLAMPLIDGKTLKEKISREKLPIQNLAEWVRQIALGLHAAHSVGIVHRDVKPGNILINDSDNRAMLTDFGLARSADDETLTRANVISGTPEYMSPEHIENPNLPDKRGDIYSLGITLYECLTGTTPFRGQAILILEQHRHAPPVRPSNLNAEVPRDLETICLKAIAKAPTARYQTTNDFAGDLKRFLDGKPILARQTSSLERLKMWAARNGALAGSLLLLFLSLLAGTGISTTMWFESSQNEKLANQRSDQLAQQTDLMQSAVDGFFASVLGDQSGGMQLSTKFRNDMVVKLTEHYAELVNQNPKNRELAVQVCEKALNLSVSLEHLQLHYPNANLTSWCWSTIKPIASSTDANASELLLAAKAALSVSQKTRFTDQADDGQFDYFSDEVRSKEHMTQYALDFGQRAVDAGAGVDAEVTLAWAKVVDFNHDAKLSPKKTIAELSRLQMELDDLGDQYPQNTRLYFYRAKARRLIGKLSPPIKAAELRGESIALFQQQLAVHKDKGENTIWSRHDIAINRIYQGVAFKQTGKHSDSDLAFETGLKEFDELLSEHPSFIIIILDLAESHWLRTKFQWQDGNFHEPNDGEGYKRTLELFNQVLNIEPNQPSTYRRLISINEVLHTQFRDRRDLENARKYLAKSVSAYRQWSQLDELFVPQNVSASFKQTLLNSAKVMEEMGFEEQAAIYRNEAASLADAE